MSAAGLREARVPERTFDVAVVGAVLTSRSWNAPDDVGDATSKANTAILHGAEREPRRVPLAHEGALRRG